MKETNEVVLSGNISDNEINGIQELLPEINIYKMRTKGQTTQEFVQLVFYDFTLLNFARDFILSNLLTGAITQIRHIVSYLRQRNKSIKTTSIEVQIKTENKEFLLILATVPDKLEMIVEMTDDKIEFIVENADQGCMMHVKLEDGTDELEIDKM